jgi:hypothetical protein
MYMLAFGVGPIRGAAGDLLPDCRRLLSNVLKFCLSSSSKAVTHTGGYVPSRSFKDCG